MTREQYRMKDIRRNIFFFILFNNISDNLFFNNDLPPFQKKKKRNGKIDYHRDERVKTKNKVRRCLKVSEKNSGGVSFPSGVS